MIEKSKYVSSEYLHSKEFNDKYYYDGTLGAIYSENATTFKLWAPTAENVKLVDYTKNQVTNMHKLEKGVWQITLDGDMIGHEYNYHIYFANGKINESVDPYAKSTTVNGARTVVVDIANTNPENWNKNRMPAFSNMVDAIIYELHIRDLTIGKNNGIHHKGKFLGLAEHGTKTSNGNPTGLDYISSLGITHVQILPINDFATVDESKDLSYDAQYNWGYDPLNYNVPEGSYSSDPFNPKSRILELKQMIQAFHDCGIRVIIDVVYNHVYNVLDTKPYQSPLEKTVPGYYFRMKKDNSFYDGTCCGNETASEQSMMRKYIVDSVCFWAKEYNIDGFRFDLMGIHDIETMQEVRKALDKIDPSIIILGEGWNMGHHPEGSIGANQNNIYKIPNIAVFNDWYRNTIKGSNDLKIKGFVNSANNIDNSWALLNNIKGMQHNNYYDFASPMQNVVYNEAHDNYTLYDHLLASGVKENELSKRHALATVSQYMCNGAIFIHAGQESLRTKKGDCNSYSSPDNINEFDYDRVDLYKENFQFFIKLNKFRKKYDFMKMRTYDCINAHYTHIYPSIANTVAINHLAYVVLDAFCEAETTKNAYVFFNADTKPWIATLANGNYEIIIDGMNIYDDFIPYISDGSITVAPLSMMLLKD